MEEVTESKIEQSLSRNTETLQKTLAILTGLRSKIAYQMDGNASTEQKEDKPSSSFNLPQHTRLVNEISNTAEDINRMYDKFVYGAK